MHDKIKRVEGGACTEVVPQNPTGESFSFSFFPLLFWYKYCNYIPIFLFVFKFVPPTVYSPFFFFFFFSSLCFYVFRMPSKSCDQTPTFPFPFNNNGLYLLSLCE